MPVEGRGGGGGRPMCCAGADAGWRGGGGIWYMAAWWAKAYEDLRGPLGVGGGAPCCDARARGLEGSTGRAANGRLARSDSTAEPQGELAKQAGASAGSGLGGSDRGEPGEVLARAQLSCAGVCGGGMRCEGVAQGITAWRGRRIELWLQTAGCGRVVAVAVAAGRAPLCTGTAPTNRSSQRRGAWGAPCSLSDWDGCGVGTSAIRLDSRAAAPWTVDRGPWRWEELEAGAGGAGASTAVDEDQTRLRPRPRRSAQRVETQTHRSEQWECRR
jgi:hypothetical protein